MQLRNGALSHSLCLLLASFYYILQAGALTQREAYTASSWFDREISFPPRKIRLKQIGRKFTSLVVPSKFSYCRFCHMTNGSGLPCFSLLQTYATVTALHRSSRQRYMSNAVKYPLVRIPFGFVKLGNWIYLRALKLRTKRSIFILSSRVTMCLGTSTCLVPQPN